MKRNASVALFLGARLYSLNFDTNAEVVWFFKGTWTDKFRSILKHLCDIVGINSKTNFYLRYNEFVKVNDIGESMVHHRLVDAVSESEKCPIIPEHGPVLEVLLQGPLNHLLFLLSS